ncbi:hypothetical protein [Streptomyces glaucescens]|uniref:hypothetical protein n=1 Tax=Streptomyces glaucescens TaxID=1907 RepID=UPI001302CE23|nr:hypothetical protein [Streptomyces glaucescens]
MRSTYRSLVTRRPGADGLYPALRLPHELSEVGLGEAAPFTPVHDASADAGVSIARP